MTLAIDIKPVNAVNANADKSKIVSSFKKLKVEFSKSSRRKIIEELTQ